MDVLSFRRKFNHLLASWSVHARRLKPLNKPTHIHLEVTNRCNIACVHCGRIYSQEFKNKSALGNIGWGSVRKLSRFYPVALEVSTTGFGEPLVHPDCLAILQYVKSHDARCGFVSNGALLNEMRAEQIVDMGLEAVWFSLDSPDPETYAKIRVGARLEAVVANIERLARLRDKRADRKPRITIEFVAMADNFLQLPALADLAHRIGIDEIVVQKLIRNQDEGYMRFYQKSHLSNLDPDEARKAWAVFEAKTAEYGIVLSSRLGPTLENLLQRDTLAQGRSDSSAPEIIGFFDAPDPMASANGTLLVCGWTLARTEGLEAEIAIEREGSPPVRVPARLIQNRPDVVAVYGHLFPRAEQCGFEAQIDVSRYKPGRYILRLLARSAGTEGPVDLASRQIFINAPHQGMYCTQPWSTVFVTWKGEVRTCCYSSLALGDLETMTIEEIWQSPLYQDLRRHIVEGRVHPSCEDCVASGFPFSYLRPLDSWPPWRWIKKLRNR